MYSVHDNKVLKTGFRTRFFCSQAEEHKKNAKPSQRPDAKHRDTLGMKRYPCNGKLSITCHEKNHYVDVSMPPEAMQMIEAQVGWLTPSGSLERTQQSPLVPQHTSNSINQETP